MRARMCGFGWWGPRRLWETLSWHEVAVEQQQKIEAMEENGAVYPHWLHIIACLPPLISQGNSKRRNWSPGLLPWKLILIHSLPIVKAASPVSSRLTCLLLVCPPYLTSCSREGIYLACYLLQSHCACLHKFIFTTPTMYRSTFQVGKLRLGGLMRPSPGHMGCQRQPWPPGTAPCCCLRSILASGLLSGKSV